MTWLFGMASYAMVLPSWKIFITLFYSGMCSAVWCMSHYIPHATDHLLISLHLTSVMGISKFQNISLKSVIPVSMLQPIMDLLHCTLLVGTFGSFIRQFIMFMLLAHNQNIH